MICLKEATNKNNFKIKENEMRRQNYDPGSCVLKPFAAVIIKTFRIMTITRTALRKLCRYPEFQIFIVMLSIVFFIAMLSVVAS